MTHKSGHNKHGGRGRHKKDGSPEAQRWQREHMQPERPAWMSNEAYVKLMRMREEA